MAISQVYNDGIRRQNTRGRKEWKERRKEGEGGEWRGEKRE